MKEEFNGQDEILSDEIEVPEEIIADPQEADEAALPEADAAAEEITEAAAEETPTDDADIITEAEAEVYSEEAAEAETETAAEPSYQQIPPRQSVPNSYSAFREQSFYRNNQSNQAYNPYMRQQYGGQPMQQQMQYGQHGHQQPVYPQYQPQQQQQYYGNQPVQQQHQYMPPYQQQYNNPPKNQKDVPPLSRSDKKIVLLVKIAIVIMALFFIYCIISDAAYYCTSPVRPASYSTDAENVISEKQPELTQESKSSAQLDTEAAPDESGKYTIEEVAAIVSPSIVEITAYSEDGTDGGTGSGIILTEDGYILTNAHVVSEYDSFEITHYDSSLSNAELVGYDSKSDLAVLKMTDGTENIVPATLGDSDELSVGEEVVAIGCPAGLTSTVTSGIVSALDRQIRSGSTGFYMECIQTDAAISPGNSGGALVNMYGQVVGITSSKYASYYSGTYEGLGFAITINQALPIAEELMDQGYISGRVRIGITFASLEDETVQQEFANALGLPSCPITRGIWITEISEDCDIANTELKVNDVIVAVNGTEINNYDDLYAIIENCKAGDVLTAECITYIVDGSGVSAKLDSERYTIEFALMEDTSGDY